MAFPFRTLQELVQERQDVFVNPCSIEEAAKVRGTKDLVRGSQYFLAKAGLQLQTRDFPVLAALPAEGKKEGCRLRMWHLPPAPSLPLIPPSPSLEPRLTPVGTQKLPEALSSPRCGWGPTGHLYFTRYQKLRNQSGVFDR